MKVMFDTNVFNHILDGQIPLEHINSEWEPVITHIQQDEINATANDVRRAALNTKVADIVRRRVPTETMVWNVSRWGEANWPGRESRYGEILALLDSKRPRPNNIQDAIIADTCFYNDFLLVTNDSDLEECVKKLGGRVIDIRKS